MLATSWSEAAAAPAVDKTGGAEPQLQTVAQVADWVLASKDNGSLPFAIIDKVAARVFVFGADGQFKGSAAALLGSARGDHSAPGVGDRELSHIPPNQRTTPAGRFLASFGPAWGGKSVLWVDYGAAISLHPVIVGTPKEHRLQRLQSPTPKDNRITFGCINVPATFYKKVVSPTFTGTSGVFYILPEAMPLSEALPAFRAQAGAVSTQAALVSTDAASQGARQ